MDTIDVTLDHTRHLGEFVRPWMREAACRGVDPAAFFPSDNTGVEAAQRLCAACPVRPECLEFALESRLDHGVWGGTSERERQRILRGRRMSRDESHSG
jgi:WhiB family transcriptional regulator, redox-sensing transcriptional regulator